MINQFSFNTGGTGGGGGSQIIYDHLRVTFDGQGLAMDQGASILIPMMPACTILGWEMVGSASGSCIIDIQKRAYPNIPSASYTIGSSTSYLPALAGAQANGSTTLTGLSTTISADDILGIQLQYSSAALTKLAFVLRLQLT